MLESEALTVTGAVGAVEENYFEDLWQAGAAPTAFAAFSNCFGIRF